MITALTGTLVSKSPSEAVVDVNGVGYALAVPLSTFAALGEAGSRVTLLTHLQVRDDALVLFGFAHEQERAMFRLLLNVNGIGPRLALNILSGVSAPELRTLIRTGNASALTALPGIGRKTAERIVVELREKLEREPTETPDLGGRSATPASTRDEALQAMLALGFPRATAEKAIRAVVAGENGDALGVEELLRKALRSAAPK